MSDAALMRRFKGIVFRAHNPRWAFAPTSGEGAARHGGRFNPPGVSALYTGLSPKTAWTEAQQGFPFKAQPMTLVAYRVDCEQVIDLSEPQVLADFGLAAQTLAGPWEDLSSRGEVPPTWALAERLIGDGCSGIVVPSFAPGSDPTDLNLVLWHWSNGPPCRVEVIDDFARLPRDDASWR